ncbi:heme/hemin ABC transporter substrate-binding protein [Hyalangium gracile]|uniref:heme/hemin ABC transporter substrate-binding protein n=1 Tax=Hyalangium gracile TaxID=394092 RepID=UPI001CCBA89E|nr:ABC transporter substrate-binding protein [Hyalangium gracile]
MRHLPAARVLSALMLVAATTAMAADPAPRKIVTVGPAITDTVLALGVGEHVVGVDDSSVSLPLASRLQKVGYQRALSTEGLLALGVQLLLVTAEAGPPGVLEQLRGVGVQVAVLPNEPTVEATRQRIRELSRLVGREERGKALLATLDQELARAATRVGALKGKIRPRILSVHARGAGALMVAGQNTTADTLIRLAGGENVITGYEGYRPLTAEAVVQARPDFILVPKSLLASSGGPEGLARLPGLSVVKGWRVAPLEDVHLMGFGARLGEAVLQLVEQFHPPERGTP